MQQNFVVEPGVRTASVGTPPAPAPHYSGQLPFVWWSYELPEGGYRGFGSANYPYDIGDDLVADNHMVSMFSPDGLNWVCDRGLRFYRQPAPYDSNSIFPTAMELDGDSIRLTFAVLKYYIFQYGGAPHPESDYQMWSGCSPDYLNFATEPGIRMPTALTPPDCRSMPSTKIEILGGYRWYLTTREQLYAGHEYTKSAITTDGLNFAQEGGARTYGYQGTQNYYTSTYYSKTQRDSITNNVYFSVDCVTATGNVFNGMGFSSDGLNVCMEPAEFDGLQPPVVGQPTLYWRGGFQIDQQCGNGYRTVQRTSKIVPEWS